METRDFSFYGEPARAQRPAMGKMRPWSAKLKVSADASRTSGALRSPETRTKGLIGASPWMARPQASPVPCMDEREQGGAPRERAHASADGSGEITLERGANDYQPPF